MSIKSLEERIRADAAHQATVEVARAFAAFQSALKAAGFSEWEFEGGDNVRVDALRIKDAPTLGMTNVPSVKTVLAEVQKAVLARVSVRREDAAIEAFRARVIALMGEEKKS